MASKKKFDKEEIQLMLNSNRDAAALWYASTENTEKIIHRLPAPLYTLTRTWDHYSLSKKPSQASKISTSTDLPDGADLTPTDIKSLVSETPAETISILSPVNNEIHTENEEKPSDEIVPIPTPTKKAVAKKEKSEIRKKTTMKTIGKLKKEKSKANQDSSLDFYTWLKSMNPEETEILVQKPLKKAISTKKEAKKSNKSTKSIENKAAKTEEPVSETLAKLLARQGHRVKAINMYKKLMKKFPQKESTFAAAIKKLKS